MSAWDKLSMFERADIMKLAVKSGIYNLDAIRNEYNKFAEGGDIKEKELPPIIPFKQKMEVVITPDQKYNTYLNTLPDNQRFTPNDAYDSYLYWKLNGKPKNFKEAYNKGMFTYNNLDKLYHADSITFGDDGIGYFMKPKTHSTVGFETDWYNKGLVTEEDGTQRSMTPEERAEWLDFRNQYDLIDDPNRPNYYRYEPKNKHYMGGPIVKIANEYKHGGGIHIDPSKKGTFTTAASRHNMGVQEFASKVLANKDNYSPAMVKKANFARNAAKWHGDGGELSLLDKVKANLSARLMNAARKNHGKGNISDKMRYDPSDPATANGGVAQSTYLLDRNLQRRMFLEAGYQEGTEGDYGLVRKAVGDRKLPVFQRKPDVISRQELVPFGNAHLDYSDGKYRYQGPKDTELIHAGNYPIAYYVDNEGKMYTKAWDLNDYGNASSSGRYSDIKQALANALDYIGNPTVVTTGFQPVVDESGNHVSAYPKGLGLIDDVQLNPEQRLYNKFIKDRGLHLETINGYGQAVPMLPEVVVTGKKNRNASKWKHGEGGNLFSGEEKHSQQIATKPKQVPWYTELNEAVLGEVMQQLRNIAHPGNSRDVSYRGDVRGKNGGTAQRTYLLPRSQQEDIFLRDGYIKGQEGDYGLVKKAVGNRNLPVWQTAPDAVSRKTLVPIGDDYGTGSYGYINRDKELVNAESHPAAFYVDGSTGKLYIKGWDLNDYGGTGGGRSSNYNIFKKAGADILDFIGNPVVVTTGFQEVTNPWGGASSHLSRGATIQDLFDDDYYGLSPVGQMLDDTMSKKGLHREQIGGIGGKWLYALPEVTVTGKKNRNVSKWKHAFGGPIPKATRATPTLKRKSWETDEEYKERISSYSKVDTAAIIAENQRIIEENKRNRQQYLQTEEGKRRQAQIQKEDTKLFKNINVPVQNTSSLDRGADMIQKSFQSEVNKAKSLGNEIKGGAELQQQERLDKLNDYKKGIEATATALELGLSGASLLGAYSNYMNWANSANVAKKTLANLLQKAQLPMQVGGTMIDAYQTFDAMQNKEPFETYYNASSMGLGAAGSIGASDVFLNSRFHNPRVDRVLDVFGILQNTGDFIKFGYDTLAGDK